MKKPTRTAHHPSTEMVRPEMPAPPKAAAQKMSTEMATESGARAADELAAGIVRFVAESNLSGDQMVYAATEALARLIGMVSERGTANAQDALRRQMLSLGQVIKHISTRLGPNTGG